MIPEKLRRQIAFEAARLLVSQQESELLRAKRRAALKLGHKRLRGMDLPTNDEIREQLAVLARTSDMPAGIANGHSADHDADRYKVFHALLTPLEAVRQRPEHHPEGDTLYHSLQVFDLARNALPYDEEFQLAALLHDVGKAIDPRDSVRAGLDALNGHLTERTSWLIEHLGEAKQLRDGFLGQRSRKRLESAPDFEELMLLVDCERRGRQTGVAVPDVADALQHVRDLAEQHESE